MIPAQTDTLIVGGGLSGLALARMLQAAGRPFHLLEARARLGGRVLTHKVDGAAFDLGPAWFWPGQPRMASLVQRYGLEVFEQASDGDFRYESPQGQIQQGRGGAAMRGSLRLAGGMQTLVSALADDLPSARLSTGTAVAAIARENGQLRVTCTTGKSILAHQVVLTLPPRLAAAISYTPALSDEALDALQSIPTWMAGQAKAVALYDRPFWRDAGLSGDAMSHRGPLVEIHDASPCRAGPCALFGFVGTPPAQRGNPDRLRQTIAAQLTRLFGPSAPAPREVLFKDWAADAATATMADAQPLAAHPRYGKPPPLRNLWDGQLHVSGSETGETFGGYLEGALEAAEASFVALTPARRSA